MNINILALRLFLLMGTVIGMKVTALANCKVCKNPKLGGDCKTISSGQEVRLDSGWKNQISSVKVDNNYGLKFWTWEKDNRPDIGYIYKIGGEYQFSFHHANSPEYWLNHIDDDIDTVRCDYYGDWKAVLYADPGKSGRRVYLNNNSELNLLYVDTVDSSSVFHHLKDEVSSLELKSGTRLLYNTNNYDMYYEGWIERDSAGIYSSSAGGGDDTPEDWLKTNDNIDVVTVGEAPYGCFLCSDRDLRGDCIELQDGDVFDYRYYPMHISSVRVSDSHKLSITEIDGFGDDVCEVYTYPDPWDILKHSFTFPHPNQPDHWLNTIDNRIQRAVCDAYNPRQVAIVAHGEYGLNKIEWGGDRYDSETILLDVESPRTIGATELVENGVDFSAYSMNGFEWHNVNIHLNLWAGVLFSYLSDKADPATYSWVARDTMDNYWTKEYVESQINANLDLEVNELQQPDNDANIYPDVYVEVGGLTNFRLDEMFDALKMRRRVEIVNTQVTEVFEESRLDTRLTPSSVVELHPMVGGFINVSTNGVTINESSVSANTDFDEVYHAYANYLSWAMLRDNICLSHFKGDVGDVFKKMESFFLFSEADSYTATEESDVLSECVVGLAVEEILSKYLSGELSSSENVASLREDVLKRAEESREKIDAPFDGYVSILKSIVLAEYNRVESEFLYGFRDSAENDIPLAAIVRFVDRLLVRKGSAPLDFHEMEVLYGPGAVGLADADGCPVWVNGAILTSHCGSYEHVLCESASGEIRRTTGQYPLVFAEVGCEKELGSSYAPVTRASAKRSGTTLNGGLRTAAKRMRTSGSSATGLGEAHANRVKEKVAEVKGDADASLLLLHTLDVGHGLCHVAQCISPEAAPKTLVLDCGSSGSIADYLTKEDVVEFLRAMDADKAGGSLRLYSSHPDRDHFTYLRYIGEALGNTGSLMLGGRGLAPNEGQTDGFLYYGGTSHLQLLQYPFKHSIPVNGYSRIVAFFQEWHESLPDWDVGANPSPDADFLSACGAELKTLTVNNGERGESNKNSSVLTLTVERQNLLKAVYPGDATYENNGPEAVVVDNGLLGDVTKYTDVLLWSSHHGSGTHGSNALGFLTAVNPTEIWISAGTQHGLPDCSVVRELIRYGKSDDETKTLMCGDSSSWGDVHWGANAYQTQQKVYSTFNHGSVTHGYVIPRDEDKDIVRFSVREGQRRAPFTLPAARSTEQPIAEPISVALAYEEDGPMYCVGAQNGEVLPGGAITVGPCDSAAAQQFIYDRNTFTIKAAEDAQLCVEAVGLSSTDAHAIVLGDCGDSEGQAFVYRHEDRSIRWVGDQLKCLSAPPQMEATGGALMLMTCSGDRGQKFWLR